MQPFPLEVPCGQPGVVRASDGSVGLAAEDPAQGGGDAAEIARVLPGEASVFRRLVKLSGSDCGLLLPLAGERQNAGDLGP